MKAFKLLAFGGAIVIYLCSLSTTQAQLAGGVIEIEPTQLPTAQAVKKLFKLPPTRGPAKNYLDQIKEKCGWLDPLILAEFTRLNGVGATLYRNPEEMGFENFLYPACVRVSPSTALVQGIDSSQDAGLVSSTKARQEIRERSQSITEALSVAKRVGEAAPQAGNTANPVSDAEFTDAREVLKRSNDQPVADGDRIRAEAFAQATVALAERVIKDPQAAVDTVREAEKSRFTAFASDVVQGSGAVEALESTADISSYASSIIYPLQTAAATADCSAGSPSMSTRRVSEWPLDTAALLDTLLLNASERARRGRSASPASVLVADTGFPLEIFTAAAPRLRSQNEIEPTQFFTPDDFYAIEDERGQDPNDPQDQNGDDVRMNEFGFSLNKMNGEIQPVPVDPHRDHGMSVASIVIGGLQLYRYRMLRTLPIRLHFANLMDENVSPVRMSATDLGFIIPYAQKNQIDIVNMSFESRQPIRTLRDYLDRTPNMLVVAAAGNSGESLNETPMYPARFGGGTAESAGVVITVGAHREDGTAAEFSNYGDEHADVFAPGCFISVPTLTQADGKLKIGQSHGTSFAAPLVTFVAALLRSDGLRAQEIKRRIILSAKHDRRLLHKARFGARLDPQAALTIYNDILDLKTENSLEGERLRGRLNRNAELKLPAACGGPRKLRDLFRLEFVDRDSERKVSRYKTFIPKRGAVRFYEQAGPCEIADGDQPILNFYDIEAFQERSISLERIARIIMRER